MQAEVVAGVIFRLLLLRKLRSVGKAGVLHLRCSVRSRLGLLPADGNAS